MQSYDFLSKTNVCDREGHETLGGIASKGEEKYGPGGEFKVWKYYFLGG
jgi:hypothetical protein